MEGISEELHDIICRCADPTYPTRMDGVRAAYIGIFRHVLLPALPRREDKAFERALEHVIQMRSIVAELSANEACHQGQVYLAGSQANLWLSIYPHEHALLEFLLTYLPDLPESTFNRGVALERLAEGLRVTLEESRADMQACQHMNISRGYVMLSRRRLQVVNLLVDHAFEILVGSARFALVQKELNIALQEVRGILHEPRRTQSPKS